MGLPRGLKPAAGVFLGLGAGYVVVALDLDSDARRHAAALRREVLIAALHRRLHGESTATSAPGRPAAAASGPRFYAVTGPDENLTSLGRESVSHALLCGRAEALMRLHSKQSDGGDDHHDGILSRRPARLAVPYDLTLGSGQFSSLVEQQMLRSQDVVVEHGGGRGSDCDGSERRGANDGLRPELDEENRPESDGEAGLEPQHQPHGPWGSTAGEVNPQEGGSPQSPPSTATVAATATQVLPPVSTWESLVLWATLVVLDGQQLDDAAIWALERVLSGVVLPHDNNDQEGLSLPAGPTARKSCNFVLEIEQPATTKGGASGERSEPGGLCGDVVRLGWRLASLRVGSVVVR